MPSRLKKTPLIWLCSIAALFAIGLLAACSPAAPALELTESYQNVNTPLTFQYPAGWETSRLPDASVVLVSRHELLAEPTNFQPEDCGMIMSTFTPEYLASIVSSEPRLGNILKSTPPQAGEVLDLVLDRIGRETDERRSLELGGRPAEFAILADNPDDQDDRQIGLVIIANPDGDYIYMQPIASAGEFESTCQNTFLAIAETLQSNSTDN